MFTDIYLCTDLKAAAKKTINLHGCLLSSNYTENNLGCPVLDDCGHLGKYFYTKDVDYKTFKHVDAAGLIHDADMMIDFSHVKGHGSCGYGGAYKNTTMGCVTDRTCHEIHALDGLV